ncbi:MAG: MBL fold metallo-hydrolase [Oleiphilus sp.]|nr:MAG: MBL fold metallo-hydrolase [Oleiphilus sp.]
MKLARLLTLSKYKLICTLILGISLAMAQKSNAQPGAGEIGFSVLHTGVSAGALEATVVDTGSWWRLRKLVHVAILIQHPEGDILLDTGLGKNIDAQFRENDLFDRALFNYQDVRPAADQLKQQGYDFQQLTRILPSHLHWDHASGLEDFPGTPVWVQEKEYDQAQKGEAPAHLKSQLDSPEINWHFFTLNDEPFAGFERSLDVYGDGHVVMVDLSGHSAGHIGLFLTTSSGQVVFFIGDTSWTIKGIKDNAGRPGFLKTLAKVDWKESQNLTRLANIHKQQKTQPNLLIVPAHDEFVMATLPQYPQFRY